MCSNPFGGSTALRRFYQECLISGNFWEANISEMQLALTKTPNSIRIDHKWLQVPTQVHLLGLSNHLFTLQWHRQRRLTAGSAQELTPHSPRLYHLGVNTDSLDFTILGFGGFLF